jgi:anti-sigma factor RsiW
MPVLEKDVLEEELHAWLDGELPPEREAAVEAYLAAHPEERERLESYRDDGAALARVFAYAGEAMAREAVVGEGMPGEAASLAPRVGAPRRGPVLAGWRRAAAILLIFGAGAGAGWLGRDRMPTGGDDLARFAQDAAEAHAVLARGGVQPITVAGTSPEEIEALVSAAIGVRVKLPDASRLGYQLVAGTFMPTPNGRAAQLAFRDATGAADTEISVYFEGKPGATETPFRRFDAGHVTTMAWEDDDLACAISGIVPADRLERMGRLIYEALES